MNPYTIPTVRAEPGKKWDDGQYGTGSGMIPALVPATGWYAVCTSYVEPSNLATKMNATTAPDRVLLQSLRATYLNRNRLESDIFAS
jgi:hypothetical protein